MNDLNDSLTVALLTWATWAIRSQSLICPERSELIAHCRSFDLSEQMSEFQALSGSGSRVIQYTLSILNKNIKNNYRNPDPGPIPDPGLNYQFWKKKLKIILDKNNFL